MAYLLFLAIDLLKRVSQISNNFKIYSTSLAIDKVIFLCLILFFFLFGYNLNAYNLLFLVNISCLFSILFIILILKRNLNLKFNGSFEVKEFYNFSKLTFVISLISSIYSYQFLIVIFQIFIILK